MNHAASLLFFAAGLWIPQVLHAEAPYPESPVIAGFTLDWSTHRRSAPGSDNFQLTWADDGHLYGAWGDGGGFGGTNREGRVGLGVARLEGPAHDYRGYNVWGGKDAENPAAFDGKSWGMLSVRGSLFMWVVPDVPEGKSYRNHYEYVELARSDDRGATWNKADWKFQQAENVTIPTFLNFGKDHEAPERFGGYVYSYFIRPESPNIEHQGSSGRGLIVHKPGVIYLARVRPGEMFSSKSKHEFFRGLDPASQPLWGSVDEKAPPPAPVKFNVKASPSSHFVAKAAKNTLFRHGSSLPGRSAPKGESAS